MRERVTTAVHEGETELEADAALDALREAAEATPLRVRDGSETDDPADAPDADGDGSRRLAATDRVGPVRTRYEWTVTPTDGATVRERRSSTLVGVGWTAAALVACLLVGAATAVGPLRSPSGPALWEVAVASSPPGTVTVAFVGAWLLFLAGLAGLQREVRRPVLLLPAPLVGVVLLGNPELRFHSLVTVSGFLVQPWVIVVPLLAGAGVLLAVSRWLYRPSPFGTLIERGAVTTARRERSLPVGAAAAAVAGTVPAALLIALAVGSSVVGPASPVGVSHDAAVGGAGAWMAAVTGVALAGAAADAAGAGVGLSRLGGTVSLRERRLWVERIETTTTKQRLEVSFRPRSTLLSDVAAAASDAGVRIRSAVERGDGEVRVAGRSRSAGTTRRYGYSVDAGDAVAGRRPVIRARKEVPNGYRLVVALAIVGFAGLLTLPFWSDPLSPVALLAVSVFLMPWPMGTIVVGLSQVASAKPLSVERFDGEYVLQGPSKQIVFVAAPIPVVVLAYFRSSAAIAGAGLAVSALVAAVALRHRDLTLDPLSRRVQRLPRSLSAYPLLLFALLLAGVTFRWVVSTSVGGTLSWVVLIYAALPVAVTVGLVGAARASYRDSLALFRSENADNSRNPLLVWGLVAASPALLIATAAVFLDAVLLIDAALRPSPVIAAVAGTAALSPVLYFAAGLCYQSVSAAATRLSFARRTVRARDDALPGDVSTGDYDADVRLYEGPPGGAVGYATGRRSVICLPHATVALFDDDPDALAAVLAHEDAHASAYSDGLLSTYVPFAATALLVGQNGLYAALDFRSREFRADAYSAERVSADAVDRALSTVKRHGSSVPGEEEDGESGHRSAASLVPFVPLIRGRSAGARTFGGFFGGFAMTDAHPDVDERIERVRDRCGTAFDAAGGDGA